MKPVVPPSRNAPDPRSHWRAFDPDDFPLVQDLFGDQGTGLSTTALTMLETRDASTWDAVVATSETGDIQALSLVAMIDSELTHCVGRNFALPGIQGKDIWREALSWQMSVAQQLGDSRRPGQRGTLEVHVHPGQNGLDSALRAYGFSWYSSTIEMTRALTDLPDLPDLGPYVSVESWNEQHEPASRRLLNRLLVDDSENAALSRAQWDGQCESAYPEWSHVLVDHAGDRPNIQGFVLAGAPSDALPVVGAIDMVAVAESAQSSAYFQALTLASMLSQEKSGLTATTVTVNEPGDPFTTQIYQSLGFENSYEVRSFTATL